MATMVSAITTTAVFSVVLSSFVSDIKADKRDAAAMVLKRAQETLRSYVSVDPASANLFPGAAVGIPGSPGIVPGKWAADSSGAYALADGTHYLNILVNTPPLTEPGKAAATLRYTVTSFDCGFTKGAPPIYPLACKKVVFTLTYAE